ncbi:MAG: NCS2 family permease [Lachnospiraceae bacterium]|nr:NCS2 family permease [Lachnospiraceae bacterium]
MLKKYFEFDKYNTNMKTEILAGLTTFITLAYILILNPQILSDPYAIMGDGDMASKVYNGVFIGTCIGAFIGTFLCAIYAKVPFAQAPGMGLNAFFAYTVVLGLGYSYQEALVIVFISGLLFIFITVVGLREAIIRAIPQCIKGAITPGIGLFITIIGLKNAGLVVGNDSTLVAMLNFAAWREEGVTPEQINAIMGGIVALIGLVVIAVLAYKKVTASILIGIVVATIVGIPLGVTRLSDFTFNLGGQFRDFAEISLFRLDFAGLFGDGNLVETIFTVVMLVISFSLVNMFDSIGTLYGAAKQAGMVNEKGEVYRMKEALLCDAVSTAAGALVGTSTVTTMVESSAGVGAGGRTGMTSLTTSLMFIAAILLAPFVAIVPSVATAPALIFVGISMLSNLKDVDFEDMSNALPAFCTVIFMPFTYSIANGIAMGLITFCLVKALLGKFKEIKPLTLIVAIVFILRYAFMAM